MLDSVRRWLTGTRGLPAWNQIAEFARARHLAMRRTMAHDGWVLEGGSARPGWRVEWGPAQRNFMSSHELRVRLEVPQSPELQVLVLDRPLLARLDREVYQQFVGSVHTRLDEDTPEEMRWLAMHAKLTPNQLGPLLRDRYGAIATDTEWAAQWLKGPLAQALHALAETTPVEAVAAEPFMLRLSHGKLVLRQAAPLPRVAVLQACLDVAEAAAQALDA